MFSTSKGYVCLNYANDSNHAPLVNRSGISGFDSSYSTSYITRGNVTGVTKYLLSNGSVTGSVSSYNQYDIAGNVVKTIDARGYATTYNFSDRFGAPGTEAQSNTAPSELAGQSSFAFPTLVTNALGHTTYGQYDFYLGLAVDTEDANGILSSAYFNDPLDRATQMIAAANPSSTVKTQTSIVYDDPNRTVTSTSDKTDFNDNLLKSQTVFDGLSRTLETRQYETSSNYIAVRHVPYTVLQDGGVWFIASQTSNPFRPYLGEQPVWSTSFSDALGRTVKVRTPDNASVTSAYTGRATTITDQAGKKRKSVVNEFGLVAELYEDPQGLNYLTTYAYDVLGNLVRVTQGSQQRHFMYDSLKRLIRARNPEHATLASLSLLDPVTNNSTWSIGYQYDANGNLTQKTDPRGVVSTYAYDALNRSTTVDHSNTASINPDVQRFYDGATNGKGQFWYHYTNGNFSTGSNVEHTSIDSYDMLGRPLVQRQRSKLNGVWSPTYQTSRTYNRAGRVTSQTYPSGRMVTYSYDSTSRTTSFAGNLGDSVTRTYASTFVYNARNQVTQELFGTQTALYHKLQYNIRGQLWDVRVSTGADINGSWNRGCLQYFYDGSYGYGTSGPDNNGNVRFANTYIPKDDQAVGWAIHRQDYSYDSLNRLASVAEYFVSNTQAESQQSLQSYAYDRWGNRTINPVSWGTGINEKQFTVDTNTNRLGVPAGQPGTMSYDDAGNLSTDSYSGYGARTFDADNRMTSAQDSFAGWSYYTYNADGQRTRRKINNQETWQIYGIGGELLAEYAAGGAAGSPQKEYGYRDGKLLIVASSSQRQWVVPDNLGTPRMVIDQSGSLASVRRHDYLPFGEELFAGTGGRTAALGYAADGVRQQFTSQERDTETGLDYFRARYYSSTQGRFISPDEPFTDQSGFNPQSWNLYSFVRNNPLNLIDPTGTRAECPDCPDGPPLTPEEIAEWDEMVESGAVDSESINTNFCTTCGPHLVWDNGDPLQGDERPGTYRYDIYADTWVRRTWSDKIWQAGKDMGMADLTFWLGGATSRGSGGIILGARTGMGAAALLRTSELVITHGLTNSRRAIKKLIADISENGIKEPIKYVEVDGQKYVVDGHHRLRAARQLGMREVPAERVSLPYLGYKTVDDLFTDMPY